MIAEDIAHGITYDSDRSLDSFSKLADWMADVNGLKNYNAKDPFCMPLNGVYMRFTGLDKTLIAGGAVGDGFKDIVVHIKLVPDTNNEIIENGKLDDGLSVTNPPHQFHIYQEINQMSLNSPSTALGHIGVRIKLQDFIGASSKYKNFSKFLKAKKDLIE